MSETSQSPAGGRVTVDPPSGEQVELSYGEQRAVVVEVGGALREYLVDELPVLDGYGEHEMCAGARGQSLIPWPNRIQGGRYEFDGEDMQLPLTEPDQGNAIHGLVRWENWQVRERAENSVVMVHRLRPQPGYPFDLDCSLEYQLAADGLTVRTTVVNVGSRTCPFGTGAHPYLTVGTETIDEAVLTAPGAGYLPTDERGIPVGSAGVSGTGYDFRAGRSLAGVRLDHSFTGLARDADGRAWVELSSADGDRRVLLWLDETYPYLELFTGDTLPQTETRRRGLGVEPMTCAPNAFRTGDGLQLIQPGQVNIGRWGVRTVGSAAR